METLTDDILKEIFSNSYYYKLYDKFNEKVEGNTLTTEYCTKITEPKDGNNGLYDLCVKVEKQLTELKDSLSYKDQCLHFLYWIYYRVWLLSRDNSYDHAVIFEHLNNIKECLNKKKKTIYNCPYYSCNKDILTEWVEEKFLYDYFTNFDTITKNYCSDTSKRNNFKKYINSISSIYLKHKSYCCPFKSYRCLKYFSCDEKHNPANFFTTVTCDSNKLPVIKNDEKYDWIHKGEHKYFRCTEIKTKDGTVFNSCSIFEPKTNESTTPTFNETNGKNQGATPSSLSDTVKEKTHGSNSAKGKGSQGEVNSESSQSGNVTLPQDTRELNRNETKCEKYLVKDASGNCAEPNVRETGTIGFMMPTADKEMFMSILSGNYYDFPFFPGANNKFTRIGVSFLLILGILLVLFIYYKFTPFGSVIHRRMLKKKEVKINNRGYPKGHAMSNVKPRVHKKATSRTPKNMNTNKQGARTRIAYNPT
ncbi:variable surface protein [Plasmodium gonderi]|uniref:Variable surface protein n=1 Tax=Plasmodium gonderi TaxID=77519 RepID=A0A1Y1JC99_PLAGO|nr:variable surface protein [Plasmodium gonderi]GAW79860.1 variable surface protein [Plasmodium gonderi]